MSETITLQPTTQPTQPQRVRSPNRIRDAFLQLTLIIDGESQIDASLLRDALNQSDLTPQDRAELVRLVSSTDLFSHLPDLGDRVATFVVNPQTGSTINANSTASYRRETTRLAQQWDAAILAARESEYLQSQGIVNSNGEFIYRTLKGARFPRMVSHNEIMENRDPQRVGSYTLLTDFSSWSAEPNRYAYNDPDNGDYSTSAADSNKVYAPASFQIECESNVIPLSPHAHDRMMKYGYNDSSVRLTTKVLSAQVSYGRTVPLPMKERSDKKLRSAEYRLTLEINDAKMIIEGDRVLPIKLVISCFATPKVNGQIVLLNEYIAQSRAPGS